MNDFASLVAEHQALQDSWVASPDSIRIDQVQDLIRRIRYAGQDIDNAEHRDQLRAILRYWGTFIYERTGAYPATQLAPYVLPRLQPVRAAVKRGARWLKSALRIIASLLVILLVVLSFGSALFRNWLAEGTIYPHPPPPPPISPTATPVAIPQPWENCVPIVPDNAYRLEIIDSLYGNPVAATDVGFSSGESTVAASRADGRVDIWYFLPWLGKTFAAVWSNVGQARSIDFAPSGQRLASGGNDGYIRIWDVGTAWLVAPIDNPNGFVSAVAYSPNGRLLASVNGGNDASLWDVTTGRLVDRPVFAGFMTSLAFSPDGQTLAVGGCGNTDPSNGACLEGRISFWNLATKQSVDQVYMGADPAVTALAYSPDGRKFAAGVAAGSIILWDLDQEPSGIRQMGSYGSAVYSLSFNPNASLLAASSLRGFALLWDVQTGAPIDKPFTDPPKGIAEESFAPVAFSPTGRALAIGQTNGAIAIWGVCDPEPVNTAQ